MEKEGGARRARSAASDGAAELQPPLARECLEHELQILEEPRGREAEGK